MKRHFRCIPTLILLVLININIFAAGGGGGLPSGATSLSCGSSSSFNLDASGFAGGNPTGGDTGCNPCCYAGADLDGDGLQDVPFSVENSEWFQFCNTSGSSMTVDMNADETGSGSTCNIQGAVWVGASLDASTLDCGNSEYQVFDSNVGGAADGFTFSNVTIPAGQCAYMMVDGYGGQTCSTVTVSVICPCTPPAAPTASATPNPVCSGSNVTLNASNITGATYSWTGPGGFTSTSQNPTVTGITTTGTYSVTASVSGCTSIVSTVTVTVKPKPVASASPQTICSGTTSSVALTSTVAGTTYTWTSPTQTNASGGSAGSGSTISQTLTATGTTAGIVTYTITPTANGCIGNTITVIVTVNPKPVGSATPQTICSGTSSSVALTSNIAGTTYTWTSPTQTGATGGASGSGSTISQTLTTTGAVNGTVTYTVTPTAGSCPGNTFTVTVTVTPGPVATFSYTGSPYCKNGSNPSPTFSGGGVAGTFTATPAGLSITAGTGVVNLASSTAGTYTVTNTIAASGGCPAVVATSTITITPLPVATFSYTGTPYCQNAANPSPTYSGGGVAGTFTASPAGLSINVGTGNVNLGSSTVGTYTVTNTIAAAGGCPAVTATSTITITPVPVATFSYTGSPYCKNAANPSPTFSGGGVAGTFTSTAGLSITAGTGVVNLAASTAGTYTVTNTIAASGGCPALTATATITITPLPVATFSYTGTPYCQNAANPSPTFSGGGVAGTFTSTAGLSITAGTGVVNLASSTAGTYTVTNTIAAAGGCPAVTATSTISITPVPVATFSYTGVPYCKNAANPSPTFSGGGVAGTFTSSAGLSITAGTGVVNLAASTAGTYTVTNTIAASGGCPAVTATATITITPLPVATFSYTGTPYCQTAANPSPTFSGGGVAGTFTSSAGLSINSATGAVNLAASTTGTYTVTNTIAASGGCPAVTATSTITINLDNAAFSYSSSTYCQTGANPTPTITGLAGGTFAATPAGISLNAATGLITLSTSSLGTYAITYTTNGSCPNSSVFNVTITTAPVATFSYAGPYCQGGTNPSPTFSPGASAGTFTSTAGLIFVSSSTGQINLSTSTPGTYTVTNSITAAGGCSAALATASVTISPLPVATFSYTASPYCQNAANPSPTFIGGGIAGTFTSTAGLSITAGTGVVNLVASTAGTYTVTNTIPASAGCAAVTATASITITPLPVATFSYTGTPYCQNAANPSPTFSGGGVAGTFSSSAGLSINGVTGVVNLASSTTGTYTVTNTIAASSGCAAVVATSPITITPLPVATFSYAGPYCQNGSNPSPAFSGGGVAGAFTSSAGLSITAGTGLVNLAGSTAGTYTVTNTIASSGSCPAVTATATITITPLPVATFSYTGTPYCQGAGNPSPTFSGGGAAGIFTSTAGLNVDAVTGVVDLTTSTVGTYTVTNTISASGGCPAVTVTATITISFLPVATFSYTATPYCQGGTNPSPTFTGGGVAGTFSSTAGLNFVSASTGEINLTSSTPGTYTVTNTIAASAGCAGVTATSSVTINPLPVATFSYTGTPYCQNAANPAPAFSGGGVAGVFSSTAGLNINSSTGVVDLLASTTGTYTVTNTIAAASGCPAVTATSTITITLVPVATFSYTASPYCQSGVNPLPTFSGGGVAGAFSSTVGLIFISTTTGEINLIGSTAGTYTVTNTIAGSGGCAAVTATSSITITPLPVATFSYTGTPYCQNAANPAPTFSGGGVAGVFSSTAGLSINSSSGVVDLLASTAGTYTVTNTIAAANGCPSVIDSTSITINVLDDAGFIYSSSTYCQSGTDPSAIIVGLTGGVFSFGPAGLTIDPVSGLITLASSSLGTYTVTYNTNGPCPTSSTFNITVTNAPSAAFSYAGPYCQGSGVNPLPSFIVGASGGTFSSSPTLFINASTGEIDLVSSIAGTYTVTNDIPSAGGCAASSATTTVTIDPSAVAMAGTDDIMCASDIYTLSGSVSGGASSLTWTSPTSGIFSDANSGTSAYTPSAADVSNGTVILTLTTDDPAGACSAVSDDVILTIEPIATADAGVDGSICATGAYTLSGSTGGSATALTWSSPTGGVFSDVNSGSSTYTPSAADVVNGSVVLTITSNVAGTACSVAVDSMVLTITPLDNSSFSYSSGTFCQSGTDPSATITGTTGGTFSSGTGLVIDPSTGLITLATSTLGTYTVTYTTPGACSSFSTTSVTITNIQSATFSYSTPFCQSDPTNPLPTFPSGSSGGIFTSTAGISIDSISGAVNLGLSTPGNYTITNTIPASGGCAAASATSAITIDSPAIANAGADSSICSNALYNLSGSIGGTATSLLWSTSGGGTFGNSTLGSTTYTPSAADSTAGSVTLTITTNDPSGACSAVTDDMVLFINPLPNADAGTTQTLTCIANTVVLNGSTTTGGASFYWTGPGIVSGDSTTSPTVNVVGTYTVTVTSSLGCSSTSTVSVISNTNVPNANAGADQILNCITVSVILGGSSTTVDAAFSWSGPGIVTGGSTSTPTVNATGTYTLTVTDTINGCSAIDSVDVTNNSILPDANAGAGLTLTCAITTGNLNGSSTTAGATYNWTGPGTILNAGTLTPTINSTGIYTLTVTDPSNSCTFSSNVIVISDTAPPVASAGSDQTIDCANPTVNLNGSGSASGSTILYNWTTTNGSIISGNASATPTVALEGTYTITVTNTANGCSATDSVAVTTLPAPIASFTADPITGAPPLNVAFTNSSQFANTYEWIFGDGNSSISTNASNLYSTPGTYTAVLVASDNLLCPDSAEVTIVVLDYFTLLIPNVFSPNGDNVNDLFIITSTGVETINVQIYDRWGLKLSEWDNVAGGWDGRTSSGAVAPDGTYYYLITVTGVDGKTRPVYKGAFTLLR